MARICRGFGMNVIAYDVYKNPDLDFVEYVSLDELLERSDLISLHCPLMDNTYHLINKETIAKMKDGVVLVNTSRGGLVKTDDLIEESVQENSLVLVLMYMKKRQRMCLRTVPMKSWSTPQPQDCYLSRM